MADKQLDAILLAEILLGGHEDRIMASRDAYAKALFTLNC